jgi:hypothetical protein
VHRQGHGALTGNLGAGLYVCSARVAMHILDPSHICCSALSLLHPSSSGRCAVLQQGCLTSYY